MREQPRLTDYSMSDWHPVHHKTYDHLEENKSIALEDVRRSSDLDPIPTEPVKPTYKISIQASPQKLKKSKGILKKKTTPKEASKPPTPK